ncbi:uncharacterized protein LOC144132384 isoform X2 [Amblyomma americanum]
MSHVQEQGSAVVFEAGSSAKQSDELASALRRALPYVTSHRLSVLMKKLNELGVRSEDQMSEVKASDLEGTVSSHEAKKLLAFFAEKSSAMDEVISEGARFTEEDDKAYRALQELPNALQREQKKRSDIHEGLLLAIDENMSRMSEDHDARMERMERTEEMLARAHKEMLEQIEGERRRRYEQLEKERLEYEQRQRERCHQRPTLSSFLLGVAETVRRLDLDSEAVRRRYIDIPGTRLISVQVAPATVPSPEIYHMQHGSATLQEHIHPLHQGLASCTRNPHRRQAVFKSVTPSTCSLLRIAVFVVAPTHRRNYTDNPLDYALTRQATSRPSPRPAPAYNTLDGREMPQQYQCYCIYVFADAASLISPASAHFSSC